MLDEFRRVGERELRSAGQVLVLSRDQEQVLAEVLGSQLAGIDVRALGLGVDLEGRDDTRPPLPPPGSDGQRLVLGTWGSLHRIKGVDLILDAMHRLDESVRPELHVAGAEVDVEFKNDMLERATGLAVRFHGAFVTGQLASHDVTHVHVAIHASRARETWGITVDEALALRIPMVLPRIGAFTERIPDQMGVLYYSPGDVAALAEVLRRLHEDRDLLPQLRARLPEVHDVVPTVDEFVGRNVDVYRAVIAGGARPVADPESATNDSRRAQRIIDWDRACAAHLEGQSGWAGPS